ncbi:MULTISPECIES: molecular chaperone DnaJ [unclassified Leptospira]|uniref:molecular chaperone DnaJ n=1 Tax=unclassified Leptospira TaxID=2633828 RepID=UPI0002BF2F73|nr:MULTISPECIES: molecular chaperone DnaJ [unclassified Leptospira]EMJ96980.1 DnaJ domain protein [Leptospira sp. B5-022]MCR1794573.1 molecular chaperone DnaJ [Leptospira sp. id769339]
MEDGDLLSRALDFYGLPKKFDANLVRSRFRELSRKYHPDSGEYETDLLFKELVQLRDVLLASLGNESSVILENSKEDPEGFQFYKLAKQKAANAIEKYFQFTDGNPVYLKKEDNPALLRLREELEEAKKELGKFLEKYPKSIWKEDTETTLKKINVWFKD